MKRKYKKRYSIKSILIINIIILLFVFGAVICGEGIKGAVTIARSGYTQSSYHMADTATVLVKGDHLSAYLEGGYPEEYEATKEALDYYCRHMNVTMIYVIMVDTSDYGRFVSIFNPVNNEVDDTEYTEWELGYKRDTTNEEYRTKYRSLYEKKSAFETVYRMKPTDGQHPHITTLVPIKDSKGDVRAILCMHRPVKEISELVVPYVTEVVICTVLFAAVVSLLVSFNIRKQLAEPVQKVSSEAARFARENTRGETLGPVSLIKEISSLALSIDTMEEDMVRYMENLTQITAEKERIDTELSLAKTIQENAVPNVFPAFPERKDFDLFASMTPAKEVGGDFYNYYLIDDDHLALVIGDVSGKGIPAALLMMETNILIGNMLKMTGTPSRILSLANETLCGNNTVDMFVTVWLGILELSTGKLTASNAGHEDMALRRGGGDFELFKTKHSMPVGAIEGITFHEYEIQLEKGDMLFIYTDGVPEATDQQEEMFGLDRMIASLNKNKDGSPQKILDGVQKSVDEFTGDAPQFDDLTMLCFVLNG